jgi:hypothetical protein
VAALNGQVIMTITDAAGDAAVCATWFFNPTNGNLRNNTAAWTDPTGTVWPAGTGALIGVNQLGRTVKAHVVDAGGNEVRRVNLPPGGRSATVAQLANASPPDGPYTTVADFNGLTFDLS